MASKLSLLALVLLAAAVGTGPTALGAPEDDKSAYHLLNPTPRHLMRELSTDRPDATESPYTVDAGHFQVELSFAEYARDGDDDRFAALPTNLKLGLTNDADLQLLFDPYLRIDDGAAEGFGDMQARLKINLWGNDEGSFAIGFMPFIQFPTGDDDLSTGRIEGGVIFPAAFELAGGWDFGVQAEIDFLRNEANTDYGAAFVHTAILGHHIVGPLDGFVEYIGIAPDDLGTGYEAYGATGLTYEVNEDVQLDVAVNVGLTETATDLNVFTGLSFRL